MTRVHWTLFACAFAGGFLGGAAFVLVVFLVL